MEKEHQRYPQNRQLATNPAGSSIYHVKAHSKNSITEKTLRLTNHSLQHKPQQQLSNHPHYDRKRTIILSQAQPSSVLHARPARSVWSTPPAQQDLMIQLQAGTCWRCFLWRANLTLPASLPTVTETQDWREAPNKAIHSKGARVWLPANSRCPGSFTIQIRDSWVGGIMVWVVLVSPA